MINLNFCRQLGNIWFPDQYPHQLRINDPYTVHIISISTWAGWSPSGSSAEGVFWTPLCFFVDDLLAGFVESISSASQRLRPYIVIIACAFRAVIDQIGIKAKCFSHLLCCVSIHSSVLGSSLRLKPCNVFPLATLNIDKTGRSWGPTMQLAREMTTLTRVMIGHDPLMMLDVITTTDHRHKSLDHTWSYHFIPLISVN